MASPRIKLDLDAADVLTYERAVDIPTPDGKPLKVRFSFRYRNREDIAALFDSYTERVRALTAERESAAEQSTLLSEAQQALDNDVKVLQDIADGWNIDAEYSAENVRKLCKKYAGAAMAVLTEYRVSLTQGRLGN